MFLFIIGLIAFFYLLHRINAIEKKINQIHQMGSYHESEVNQSQQTQETTNEPLEIPKPVIEEQKIVQAAPIPQKVKEDSGSEFEFGSRILTIVGTIG